MLTLGASSPVLARVARVRPDSVCGPQRSCPRRLRQGTSPLVPIARFNRRHLRGAAWSTDRIPACPSIRHLVCLTLRFSRVRGPAWIAGRLCQERLAGPSFTLAQASLVGFGLRELGLEEEVNSPRPLLRRQSNQWTPGCGKRPEGTPLGCSGLAAATVRLAKAPPELGPQVL